MLQDILWYDRQGFVPSDDRLTLEGYVRESAGKLALRQRFEEDPSGFVSRQIGREIEGTLLRADEDHRRQFVNAFQTEPFPGFLLNDQSFVAYQNATKKGRLQRMLTFDKTDGSLHWLEQEGLRLPIALVREYDRSLTPSILLHESVHCIRGQYQGRNTYHFRHAEEGVAYHFQAELSSKKKISYEKGLPIISLLDAFNKIIKPTIAFGLLGGTLIAAGGYDRLSTSLSFLGGAVTGLLLKTAVVYHYGASTARFFQRCENENINPRYVFLRSAPSEFLPDKTIQEQLATSENIRFRIMAYQLGINE